MRTSKIVCFVVHRNGKFLAEKRKADKEADPGCIVIPGGHVREGETMEDACAREFKEEFGLECRDFKFVCRIPYTASNKEKMDMNYFFCRVKGKPKAFEAEKLMWIARHELEKFSFDEDRKAIAELAKAGLI
ncbi:MAG: NUDIX domain-containing protein [Candidatus Aenigmatarchaeota archaeon]